MKTLKFIGLVMAMVIMPKVWAGEPPETLNLHHRDGSVIATAFTEFNRVELSGGNLVFVGRNAPVTVKLADIRKITFGDIRKTSLVPVTFETAGAGGGLIYASVVEDGRAFNSGEAIEAGNSVQFRATPYADYRVKGWRINGHYEASGATVRTFLLDINRYADGLHVEVEFEFVGETVPDILVTFAVASEGSGKLSAFILENGEPTQQLNSGDEVEAGLTVLFKAEPGPGSKIRRWRINGNYVSGIAGERSVRLDEGLYADGLHVEVEFAKEVGIESEAVNGTLNVYVQGCEIGIQSTFGIERIELLDVSGRLLRVETFAPRSRQILFPIGNVTSGVYMLKIRTTEKEETRKVIIR